MNAIIKVKDGLLWGKYGQIQGRDIGHLERGFLDLYTADQIAYVNGFVYVERLIKHYDGCTLEIDQNLKIVEKAIFRDPILKSVE